MAERGLFNRVAALMDQKPDELRGKAALDWLHGQIVLTTPDVTKKQVRDTIYHLGRKGGEDMSAHTRAHTPAPTVPNVQTVPVQKSELSGTKNTRALDSTAAARTGTESGALSGSGELPLSVIQSLTAVLDSAALQTVRSDTVQMREFFHGYLMGANTVMGILCGAMGIDTSFLGVPGVQAPTSAEERQKA